MQTRPSLNCHKPERRPPPIYINTRGAPQKTSSRQAPFPCMPKAKKILRRYEPGKAHEWDRHADFQ